MFIIKLKKEKGFTLVELLIVVSIISILSSVILTNVSDSRNAARDTHRQQSAFSLRTALGLYLIDTGKYPFEEDIINGDHDSIYWANCNVGAYQNMIVGGHDIMSELVPNYISERPRDPDPSSAQTCIFIAIGTAVSCGSPPDGTLQMTVGFIGVNAHSDLNTLWLDGLHYDGSENGFGSSGKPVYCLRA